MTQLLEQTKEERIQQLKDRLYLRQWQQQLGPYLAATDQPFVADEEVHEIALELARIEGGLEISESIGQAYLEHKAKQLEEYHRNRSEKARQRVRGGSKK